MTKIALFAAAFAALITFGSPAQAHCQRGYDCWAHAQGHYRHHGHQQQRWSYGPRQMFQPSVRYSQPRYRHGGTVTVYRGTIIVPRGTIYIPY